MQDLSRTIFFHSSLEFSLTADYNDAYISFKTEVTSGYAVSASLELMAEGGSERYSPNTEFIADDFVNGDATFWNGGATINYGSKYRVTCTLGTMYKYAQDVHIKAADGFKFVMCKEKGVSLETYSPNTAEEILALDPFISGILSDVLVAKDVLRESYLE